MKLIRTLFLFLVLLMLITGCSDDSKKKSTFETDYPTDFEDISTIIAVGPWAESDYTLSMIISTQIMPAYYELEIDSTTYNNIEWVQDNGYWYTYVSLGFEYHYGDSLSYFLILDSTVISGIINVPYFPYVSWSPLNFVRDYDFYWTLQEDTDLQIVNFYLETSTKEINKEWRIAGSKREYEIDKSYYKSYQNSAQYIDISLMPINFSLTDNALVYATAFSGIYMSSNEVLDYKKIAKCILDNN
ncbi:MAG TPA: hypothetical protein PLD62_01155 [Candidatus Cloacimonadota bacterium]|nr:hypothetical protein [Candidatus Cloacimonadota bacterium]